jgi:predicted DNA-binding protein (UPF0251 family)
MMSRRRCCGLIDDVPLCSEFVASKPDNDLAVVVLLEEIEAVRLKDMKGMVQADCAAMMGLSRPTFQRILQSARVKIATALVEGRTINIGGGNYLMKNRVFECVECKHVWEVEPCSEGGKHGYEIACPKCGSMKKMKLENDTKHACGGKPEHDHGHDQGGCCNGH